MRLGRPQRASLERDTRSRGQPGEVLKGTHHRDSGGGGWGGGFMLGHPCRARAGGNYSDPPPPTPHLSGHTWSGNHRLTTQTCA